ncbi:hypothetical protein [Pelosinus sp. IPA-1]|uniref:hypothetical protein n=1 Tax=Pelosinus sp. IPA-1 TaxID=3029569 RepID=UPI00243619B8|nr:hypothetical protein [Pelosinus sp. IPA-1]GMB00217.1 hypothetical protein PIPA1_30160 [Pelosinus sp. IPA-1]
MNWRKTNGMVPVDVTTISVGCEEEKFELYDRTRDEATAIFKIYVQCKDEDVERGEKNIQILAQTVRYILVQRYELKGIVSSSFVQGIQYVTMNEIENLHGAIIAFEAKYYAPRQVPREVLTVYKIKIDF